MRYFEGALAIFLFTTPLFSQAVHEPAAGRREEVKGTGNQPMTFVYSLDSTRVLRAEDGESITEFLYGTDGEQVGITIRPIGQPVALTVKIQPDGLSTEGMPRVERFSNKDGRHSSIRTDSGLEIASYSYRSGSVSEVKISDRMKLKLSDAKDNRVTQTLTEANDHKIRDTTAPGRDGRIFLPICLDVVSKALGFGDEWSKAITFHTTASSNLTIGSDLKGKVILYVANVGPDRVAFDASGRPLFYDLKVFVGKRTAEGGSDAIEDPSSTDLAAVTPDHIVLSHDGMVGAYISRASVGAINSFWTEQDESGRQIFRHRVTQGDIAANGFRTAPSSANRFSANKFRTAAEATCYDTYSDTICTSGPDLPMDCVTNSGINEVSCADAAGGTAAPDAAGGGSASSNQVTGDPVMTADAARAISTATQKLGVAKCQALLDSNNTTGAATLRTFMVGNKGFNDPASYFSSGITFINGVVNATSGDPCTQGNAAWTTVYGTTVRVCAPFKDYGATMEGDLLIHEVAHPWPTRSARSRC